MLVHVGDRVQCGQPLFTDKKHEGVVCTAPASGEVVAIHRGAKRKFESLVIELKGEEYVSFTPLGDRKVAELPQEEIRQTLVESGLWCSFRTRPYGKIPGVKSEPAALFITAMDTMPLAADPQVIVQEYLQEFSLGMDVLRKMMNVPVHLCMAADSNITLKVPEGVDCYEFAGPHPAGLASTHIHYIDPVHEQKVAWHIGYHDVVAIGALFLTGTLMTERIIALAGSAMQQPTLIKTRLGADLGELCHQEVKEEPTRLLSGSVLDGRQVNDITGYLGRYHQQVCALEESDGSCFMSWLLPGSDRFSTKRLFTSVFAKGKTFSLNTALWGGRRAIFPTGAYEDVMPLDIIATPLLKSLAVGDTEKSQDLGALELIEEDLALCSFVCPGKNDFGPMLRQVLTTIELEG